MDLQIERRLVQDESQPTPLTLLQADAPLTLLQADTRLVGSSAGSLLHGPLAQRLDTSESPQGMDFVILREW